MFLGRRLTGRAVASGQIWCYRAPRAAESAAVVIWGIAAALGHPDHRVSPASSEVVLFSLPKQRLMVFLSVARNLGPFFALWTSTTPTCNFIF